MPLQMFGNDDYHVRYLLCRFAGATHAIAVDRDNTVALLTQLGDDDPELRYTIFSSARIVLLGALGLGAVCCALMALVRCCCWRRARAAVLMTVAPAAIASLAHIAAMAAWAVIHTAILRDSVMAGDLGTSWVLQVAAAGVSFLGAVAWVVAAATKPALDSGSSSGGNPFSSKV